MESFLRLGTASASYYTTAAGTQYSYPDVATGGTVVGMQAAQVTGLTPSTRYYYQVGSDAYGWSEQYSFRTATTKGDRSPFTFVAYGDQGSSTGWGHPGESDTQAVSASIGADNPHLILVAGDIYYCDVQECIDDYFEKVVGNIASQAYFMTSAGNHEYYQPDDLITYTSRFNFPGRAPGDLCTDLGGRCDRTELPELWFSYDWGNVHFVSINLGKEHAKPFTGSTIIEPGEQRYEWLRSDLAAASADSDIDWIVVFAHYSLYNWGKDESHASNDEARMVLEPLIQQYGVDLFIGGHQHSYERTLPVGNNGADVDLSSCGSAPYSTCTNPLHPIYITVGTGGRSFYRDNSSSCGNAANCNLWSAEKLLGSYGHARFTVNGTSMTVEFVDIDRTVLDQVTISKDGGGGAP